MISPVRPRRKDDPSFPFPFPQRERYDVRYSNSALLLGSALFFHSYLFTYLSPKGCSRFNRRTLE